MKKEEMIWGYVDGDHTRKRIFIHDLGEQFENRYVHIHELDEEAYLQGKIINPTITSYFHIPEKEEMTIEEAENRLSELMGKDIKIKIGDNDSSQVGNIWVCNEDLSIFDGGDLVFRKGRGYKVIKDTPIVLIDERNKEHTIFKEWENYFTIRKEK